jgi:TonB family protein
METVVAPPADTDLQLLTQWGEPGDRQRHGKAAVLSVLVHVAIGGLLLSLPDSGEPPRPEPEHHVIVTPLIEPPTELTQKAPNTKPVSKEFDSVAELERPRVQVPQGAPSTTRPRAFRLDVPQPPPQKATAPLPEAPKVDTPAPRIDVSQISQAPQIQTVEKPKITLENVGAPPPPIAPGQSKIAIPNSSVDNALREAIKSMPSGGATVGDLDLEGPGGVGPGINLPPAPGASASNLELLSDPKGVDFRPYLMQILAAVRRNWMAVYPESARLGRRGRVGIQFSISRAGAVPKLVIVNPSGTEALDRAAVAGISASNPFPPLPTEYKGERIVLQFNFAYNMPRR